MTEEMAFWLHKANVAEMMKATKGEQRSKGSRSSMLHSLTLREDENDYVLLILHRNCDPLQ